jgi:phosphomannomutase
MHKLRAYVFDVDGTLTLSRTLMDPEFKKFFKKFVEYHKVYIVTGSDYPKTLEQLGKDTMHAVIRSYNCSGNSIWERGENIFNNPWTIEADANAFLENALQESNFKIRTGTHIEQRPGMVNFSVLGRGATTEQRAAYVDYDADMGERAVIATQFNALYASTGLNAHVAGATGIDIAPIGKDKSQILKDFDDMHVYFYGDMMQEGGNDRPLKNAIEARNSTQDRTFTVTDWKHTFNLLKEAY